MPLENSGISVRLRRLLQKTVPDRQLREDMAQELDVYLYQIQNDYPCRTCGWYAQRCCWRLHDLLRQGRSIDAYRRHPLSQSLDADVACSGAAEQPLEPHDVLGQVCASDLFRELWSRLRPCEQQVLELLAAEFGVREAALALKLSHATISERVARVRMVAGRLLSL